MRRLAIKNQYHLPYNRKLVERSRELRADMTAAERRIWYDYLRLQPVRVLRQRPIDNFIVDFYCASRKLVIEIDGDIHSVKDAEERDILRTEILESYGLTVVRFTNAEVLNEFESVCEKLNLLLK